MHINEEQDAYKSKRKSIEQQLLKRATLNLSLAFQDLEYWQDALLVEEESPVLLGGFLAAPAFRDPDDELLLRNNSTNDADDADDADALRDYADSLYRRGKLYMRLEQYVKANALYRRAVDAYQRALPRVAVMVAATMMMNNAIVQIPVR